MISSPSRPILYHFPLWPGCARIRHQVQGLGLDVELRDVLLSGRARQELRQAAGGLHLPCLVHGATVVSGADEIDKYLKLRYGR